MTIKYRGYVIEKIDYTELWRIYKEERPQDTVAYADSDWSLDQVKEDIDWHIENH